MSNTDEVVYLLANVVAMAKERSILESINNYFGRKDWTEVEVAELDMEFLIDLSNRKEVLFINGVKVIEFGLIDCHVEIEAGIVRSLYRQTIKPLYGCCGVGE